MAGFDAMAGLIPMVVGAGVVMKVTDSMLGSQPQPKQRRRSKNMAGGINGTTKGLNKRLFTQGKGIGASARKTAKKIGGMASPVKLGGSNSDPSKTGIFKAVKKASKKSKGGIY
mgnify:CR=1 FL=1